MPARSKKQQQFMAMAEHDKLPKSKMPKGMSKGQMREFATTSTKDLPTKVKGKK